MITINDNYNFILHHRSTLHALVSQEKHRKDLTVPNSHANYRYLSVSDMSSRLHQLGRKNRALQLKMKRLEEKLAQRVETQGNELDADESSYFHQVMVEKDDIITSSFASKVYFGNNKKALVVPARVCVGIL